MKEGDGKGKKATKREMRRSGVVGGVFFFLRRLASLSLIQPRPPHPQPTNHPQSELAFRLLCRKHGATCAYTPMMHARLFAEVPSYRAEQFSTTNGDRPLLAQFCGNDPGTVLAAARILEARGGVDAIDLNLGCPQRIARRGRYGAFLMEEPKTVSAVVSTLAAHLKIKVTAKMRIFDDLDRTIAFARMLESSGASLVAVHGRTRDAKDAASVRADWAAIAAVKRALRVPVLANGDVLCLDSARKCLEATGCDGVLSAIPLLEDPALFSENRGQIGCRVRPIRLLKEYAAIVAEHATPPRMVRGHAFRMLGDWLGEHTDLRDALNGFDRSKRRERRDRDCCGDEEEGEEEEVEKKVVVAGEEEAVVAAVAEDEKPEEKPDDEVSLRRKVLFDGSGLLTPAKVEAVADELLYRIEKSGRGYPIPVVTERAALRLAAAEAAKKAAIEEAGREAAALASIGAGFEA